MRSFPPVSLMLALSLMCITSSSAFALDIDCYAVTKPPLLVSGEVAGPPALDSQGDAPFGWRPEAGRLSQQGVHYLSTDYIHIRLVTDRCTEVASVRVGSRLLTATNSGGYYFNDLTSPIPGTPDRLAHSLVVAFPAIGDGSTDTVTAVVGRPAFRSSRDAPTVEYSVPVVRVRRVQARYVLAPITFSQTEIFNTFTRALYDTFNREQNSTVITKENGEQVRIYGYDPSQTWLTVSGLGVGFGFTFKIDKTCQPTAHVRGRFALSANLQQGIAMLWLVPPYTDLDYSWGCDVATGIPGIGDVIEWAFFSGNDAAVSGGVRGRIEAAIQGALPDAASFVPYLHGSSVQAGQLLVNLMLPAPSVEIAVPYDAFDMPRTPTRLPSDGSVMLVASGLARADHVAGAAPNLLLQSGPSGVPRYGATDWPAARTLERPSALVWDGMPVSRLLAYRTTSDSAVMYSYRPGCSLVGASPTGDPVSVRFGVNDTAADAQRLRPGGYALRLLFFDYNVAHSCLGRLSDLIGTSAPVGTGQ